MSRLSVFASFFGVTCLIVVLSIMNGFNANQEDRLLAIEPHVVVEYPVGQVSAEDLAKMQSSRQELSRNPNVSDIIQFESQDVILRTVDGLFSGAEARGMEEKGLNQLLARVINRSGRSIFNPSHYELSRGGVILGSGLARSLNVFEGDEITVMPPETLLLPSGEIPTVERVRVEFILLSNVSEIDSKMMYYIKGETLQRLADSASLRKGFELRLSETALADRFIRQIRGGLSGTPIQTTSWKDRNEILFFALKLEKIAMTTFLVLSILITVFSLITVMMMLITDKQKDIGLLMALGLSKKRTQRLFVSMGLMLAMGGVFAGLITGVLISWVLDVFPIPMPNIYYDAEFPSVVDLQQILIVVIGLSALSFFASYLPVKRTLKQTPVEALRKIRKN